MKQPVFSKPVYSKTKWENEMSADVNILKNVQRSEVFDVADDREIVTLMKCLIVISDRNLYSAMTQMVTIHYDWNDYEAILMTIGIVWYQVNLWLSRESVYMKLQWPEGQKLIDYYASLSDWNVSVKYWYSVMKKRNYNYCVWRKWRSFSDYI